MNENAENMADMLESLAQMLRNDMPCNIAVQAVFPDDATNNSTIYASEKVEGASRLVMIGLMEQRKTALLLMRAQEPS